MDLLTYIGDKARRQDLAEKIGTSPQYLWQMATGWRGKRPSEQLATAIEHATAGTVRCENLRPDVAWVRDPAGHVTGYTVPVPVAPPANEARAA